MLSLVTTDEYVKCDGTFIQCPPATNLALLVRSTLTSKIMWKGTHFDPKGIDTPCSKNLNATVLFFVSFDIAWGHKSLPLS